MPATTATPTRPTDHPWQTQAYRDYLASPEWSARRRRALMLAGHKCQDCGVKKHLEVHHLTYDYLGEESDSDLRVLCPACHRVADERRRALVATGRNLRGGAR